MIRSTCNPVRASNAATRRSACAPSAKANEVRYSPPPALSLVALVDPSPGRLADELRQLQDVIRTSATPGEAVVVMILQPSFGSTYVVHEETDDGPNPRKFAEANPGQLHRGHELWNVSLKFLCES